MFRWTPDLVELAKRTLGEFTNGQQTQACHEISRRVGHPVSRAALRLLFKREELGELSKWMQPGAKAPRSAPRDTPPPPAQRIPHLPYIDNDEEGPPTTPFRRVDLIAKAEEADARAADRATISKLVQQLREARAQQSFYEGITGGPCPPPRILPREKTSGIRELTAVVLASDWHVEEPVYAEAIAGMNSYNLEIADRRIKRFFQSIIWNIEHHRASGRMAIRDLVLWLGGDLITGYIHEELEEGNELSPIEAVLWLQPRLRDGILSVVEHLGLERMIVPCSHGNHGRTTKKRRVSTGHANSYEWLLYNHLKAMFHGDPRVDFVITPSNHQYVDVYGYTLHFHHGDELKYQGGVGGLGIPLLKRVPQWDRVRKAHVHNIGHFHQLLDYGCAVVNGSLIGYNAYAQSIGASPEPPQQAMYYMDSRRGKSMLTSLWVEKQELVRAA